MKTVEFSYDLGDQVKIHGFEDTKGFIISLWYSERGPKYEVSFFSNGEYHKEYFFSFELQLLETKNGIGFQPAKKPDS